MHVDRDLCSVTRSSNRPCESSTALVSQKATVRRTSIKNNSDRSCYVAYLPLFLDDDMKVAL